MAKEKLQKLEGGLSSLEKLKERERGSKKPSPTESIEVGGYVFKIGDKIGNQEDSPIIKKIIADEKGKVVRMDIEDSKGRGKIDLKDVKTEGKIIKTVWQIKNGETFEINLPNKNYKERKSVEKKAVAPSVPKKTAPVVEQQQKQPAPKKLFEEQMEELKKLGYPWSVIKKLTTKGKKDILEKKKSYEQFYEQLKADIIKKMSAEKTPEELKRLEEIKSRIKREEEQEEAFRLKKEKGIKRSTKRSTWRLAGKLIQNIFPEYWERREEGGEEIKSNIEEQIAELVKGMPKKDLEENKIFYNNFLEITNDEKIKEFINKNLEKINKIEELQKALEDLKKP
jgi:hypothetical protein